MSTPTATVTFQVECHTRLGDTVRVTGNCPELGDWDPAAGLALATTAEAYPTWTASVELPLHVALEFKFVRAVASGGYEWECPHLDANRFTCVLPSTTVQGRFGGMKPAFGALPQGMRALSFASPSNYLATCFGFVAAAVDGPASTLTSLDLSGHPLSVSQVQLLAGAMAGNTALRSLAVARCGLTDAALSALAPGITAEAALCHIDVSGNCFSAEADASFRAAAALCRGLVVRTDFGATAVPALEMTPPAEPEPAAIPAPTVAVANKENRVGDSGTALPKAAAAAAAAAVKAATNAAAVMPAQPTPFAAAVTMNVTSAPSQPKAKTSPRVAKSKSKQGSRRRRRSKTPPASAQGRQQRAKTPPSSTAKPTQPAAVRRSAVRGSAKSPGRGTRRPVSPGPQQASGAGVRRQQASRQAPGMAASFMSAAAGLFSSGSSTKQTPSAAPSSGRTRRDRSRC